MKNQKENTKQDYAKRMNRVLEFIQENLDQTLELDDLAKIACFSPYHFHRIFSGMIGESLKSYIRRLRLERAAVVLKHSGVSVIDVAFDAGFTAHESFTRAFASMFGASPLFFRKNYQTDIKQKQIVYWKEISMKAELVEFKKTEVAFVRHIGPYKDCESAWNKLYGWAGRNGLINADSRFLSLGFDDPQVTPSDKIRLDVCLEIAPVVEVEAPVAKKTISGGRYAMTVHKGSYMNLAETYAQLCGQWIPQNGYEIAAKPSIQVYLNNIRTTPEEELLTEVYIALA